MGPVTALLLAIGSAPANGGVEGQLDETIQAFFEAEGPAARTPWIERILEGGHAFDAVAGALRAGPRHRSDVPRGRVLRTRVAADGTEYPWLLLVPESYRPERPYMLRVELHGGMGAPEWPADGSWASGWLPRSDHLVLLPAGWFGSMWWTAAQAESLAALLDEVRRTWNVDENRVLLVGASDGCIGSIFYAFRAPTPFAAFGGSIGCPVRLTNPTLRVDGQMHLCNLSEQRFHLINGGKDRLFPVADIRAYWELFRQHGALLDYVEYPDEGHGFALTPEDERGWARFLFDARRDPLPARLSWATERTDRWARRSWLEILELGQRPTDDAELAADVVMPRICTGKYKRLKAPRPRPFGRVDLERAGNRVVARTSGVRRFRLLLSEDAFDLDAPLEVVVNGKTVHDAAVARDARCLLEYAARDLDRTTLYAAALDVDVP